MKEFKIGQEYWCVDQFGIVRCGVWYGLLFDRDVRDSFNAFDTEAEAKHALVKHRALGAILQIGMECGAVEVERGNAVQRTPFLSVNFGWCSNLVRMAHSILPIFKDDEDCDRFVTLARPHLNALAGITEDESLETKGTQL